MYEFEKCQVGFETERVMENYLLKLEVMLKSGRVPPVYVKCIYNFLIGCFWIKFTPLFDWVVQCMTSLFKALPQEDLKLYITEHLQFMVTARWLSQLEGHSNETLEKTVGESLNKTPLSDMADDGQSIQAKAYYRETLLDEEYIETKDFFYQLCRCLGNALTPCILG